MHRIFSGISSQKPAIRDEYRDTRGLPYPLSDRSVPSVFHPGAVVDNSPACLGSEMFPPPTPSGRLLPVRFRLEN